MREKLEGDDMNDKYLWDKSGEPDEDVQHLESLLREFRYQPRPLVLPEEKPPRLSYQFAAVRYAAIAAVALLALGVGIWLSVRPATKAPVVVIAPTAPTPTVTPETPAAPAPQFAPPAPQFVRQFQTTAPKARFAHHTPKRASRKSLEEEGERAKEKVLYALQITSEKLNLIAKKIQTDTN